MNSLITQYYQEHLHSTTKKQQ